MASAVEARWPSGTQASRLEVRGPCTVQRSSTIQALLWRGDNVLKPPRDRNAREPWISQHIVESRIFSGAYIPPAPECAIDDGRDSGELPTRVSVEVEDARLASFEEIRKDTSRILKEGTRLEPVCAGRHKPLLHLPLVEVLDHLIAAATERHLPAESHDARIWKRRAHAALAFELVSTVVIDGLRYDIDQEWPLLMRPEDRHRTRKEERDTPPTAACRHAFRPAWTTRGTVHDRRYMWVANRPSNRGFVIGRNQCAIPSDDFVAACTENVRDHRSHGAIRTSQEDSFASHHAQRSG